MDPVDSIITDLSRLHISTESSTGLPLGTASSSVLYTYDAEMERHKAGPDHPERPDRTAAIHRHLRDCGLLDLTRNLPGRRATREELLLVHTPEHIDRILAFASDYRLNHPTPTPTDSGDSAEIVKTKKKNFGFLK